MYYKYNETKYKQLLKRQCRRIV